MSFLSLVVAIVACKLVLSLVLITNPLLRLATHFSSIVTDRRTALRVRVHRPLRVGCSHHVAVCLCCVNEVNWLEMKRLFASWSMESYF